jgi:putative redox protein
MTAITSTQNDGHEPPGPRTITVHGSAAGFAQEIAIEQHRLAADEPLSVGGTDTGPTPCSGAALGSCTSLAVAMCAPRKRWPLESVTVRLSHSRVHAADCAESETKAGLLDHLHRDVEFTGPLSGEQRAQLLDIASKCPVQRTLQSEIVIKTHLTEASVSGQQAM